MCEDGGVLAHARDVATAAAHLCRRGRRDGTRVLGLGEDEGVVVVVIVRATAAAKERREAAGRHDAHALREVGAGCE